MSKPLTIDELRTLEVGDTVYCLWAGGSNYVISKVVVNAISVKDYDIVVYGTTQRSGRSRMLHTKDYKHKWWINEFEAERRLAELRGEK